MAEAGLEVEVAVDAAGAAAALEAAAPMTGHWRAVACNHAVPVAVDKLVANSVLAAADSRATGAGYNRVHQRRPSLPGCPENHFVRKEVERTEVDMPGAHSDKARADKHRDAPWQPCGGNILPGRRERQSRLLGRLKRVLDLARFEVRCPNRLA